MEPIGENEPSPIHFPILFAIHEGSLYQAAKLASDD